MTPQTGSSPAEGPSESLGAAVRAVSQLKSAMLQQKPQMLLLEPHSLMQFLSCASVAARQSAPPVPPCARLAALGPAAPCTDHAPPQRCEQCSGHEGRPAGEGQGPCASCWFSHWTWAVKQRTAHRKAAKSGLRRGGQPSPSLQSRSHHAGLRAPSPSMAAAEALMWLVSEPEAASARSSTPPRSSPTVTTFISPISKRATKSMRRPVPVPMPAAMPVPPPVAPAPPPVPPPAGAAGS